MRSLVIAPVLPSRHPLPLICCQIRSLVITPSYLLWSVSSCRGAPFPSYHPSYFTMAAPRVAVRAPTCRAADQPHLPRAHQVRALCGGAPRCCSLAAAAAAQAISTGDRTPPPPRACRCRCYPAPECPRSPRAEPRPIRARRHGRLGRRRSASTAAAGARGARRSPRIQIAVYRSACVRRGRRLRRGGPACRVADGTAARLTPLRGVACAAQGQRRSWARHVLSPAPPYPLTS